MTNLPPSQPPHDPHTEILEPQDGAALPGERRGRGGRKGLLIGGGVAALALVGGGAWAAMAFMSTGAQPAEALPADTLGYVSIDLDPSGAQKIEAVRTLNKFPAFEDAVGIDPDTDVRKTVFERALEGEDCSISYDDDIAPWLGDRAALAAVPDGDSAQPVLALQVTDAGAAEDGLAALRECGGAEDTESGAVVEGDWAIVAPSQELAESVSKAAGGSTLADDADFQRWTGETGDAGIMTMYAAPGAGKAILDQMGSEVPGLGSGAAQLEQFEGLAATVRFTDGALELEGAGAVPEDAEGVVGSSDVAAVVDALPDDTAAVLGLSLGEGWFDKALEGFASGMGGGNSDALVSEFEQQTGLALPEDVETLTSGGVVLVVGDDLDPEAIANAADPSAVPLALVLSGDADEIESVVQKISGSIPGGAEILGTSADGDQVVVGPDAELRDAILAGGDLGGSDTFSSVVPSDDSPAVLYVDFDALTPAVDSISGGDPQVTENLEPLRALGASSSIDGDVTRFTLKLSTD